MSTEAGTDVQIQVVDGAAAQVEAPKFQSLEEAVAAINAKHEELEKLSKNLEQSRKEEKFSKTELKRLKDELEKASSNEALSELQGKYEAEVSARTALETKVRNRVIDAALDAALKEAKAKSVSTVMKLINRDEVQFEGDEVDAKSVASIIERLRKEDSVLFDAVETPSVARAAEGAAIGSFEKEIRAAKSQQEIVNIMRRYGKA